MLLRRKGVNKPGHEEQQAYILQNQLAAEELPRWISLANADATVSDAALNDLELRSTDASAGRNSCPPQTREAFFAVRNDHLRNFLRDQGRATTGGRSVGPTSARAAVSSGDPADTAPAPRVTSSTPCPAQGRLPAEDTAEVKALKATWTTRSLRGGPAPLYHGPTARHRAANEATYAARTAAQECFGCDVHGELVPNQPHWECNPPTLLPAGGGGRLRSAAGVPFGTRHRRAQPPEEDGPARAGPSASGATTTPDEGGAVIPPLPPPLRAMADPWLPPLAFLPPGTQAPAPSGWTPWFSSQGTPHRPWHSSTAGLGQPSWGPRQVLDDWTAAQAANKVYASMTDLAAALHARLATLTANRRPCPSFTRGCGATPISSHASRGSS